MSDNFLNNLRDLTDVAPEFSAHGVSEARATEIVAHLDEGWHWRADAYGLSTQWLTGLHLETGVRVVLFLDGFPSTESNLARPQRILAGANLTGGKA